MLYWANPIVVLIYPKMRTKETENKLKNVMAVIYEELLIIYKVFSVSWGHL